MEKKLDFNKMEERVDEREIMDDFELQGEALKETLEDLDKINFWLGGNKITKDGIEKILRRANFQKRPVKILDVGCGNGNLLLEVFHWAEKRGIEVELQGIDANPHAIEIAKTKIPSHVPVEFSSMDVFSESFTELKADIILCTLTLHHFSYDKINYLLHTFIRMAGMGIVINDLQRSRLAYVLFKIYCAIFVRNNIARKDGLTSIRRSFRRRELVRMGEKLEVSLQEITWKWAFRYQWILYK